MKLTILIFLSLFMIGPAIAQESHTYTIEPSTTYVASTDLLEDVSKFYIKYFCIKLKKILFRLKMREKEKQV